MLGTEATYGIAPDQPAQLLGERKGSYVAPFVAYVDLSAKLEQWTKDSAVAVSNGETLVIWVSKELKQRSRQLLAERHGRATVRYRLLALLVYLAVRDHLSNIEEIVIDRDYEGAKAEATIKNVLLNLLRQNGYQAGANFVRFANVKNSRADQSARRTYIGKERPTKEISWEEIEQQIKKLGKATKSHNRRIA
jgi:hypothetical protein